jgi:hypothetical protein
MTVSRWARFGRSVAVTSAVLVLAWSMVSRLVVPIPGASACATRGTTGVVLGVHAGLSVVALSLTIMAGWLEPAWRTWAFIAVVVQVVLYAMVGLFEYGSYGGFCDFRF